MKVLFFITLLLSILNAGVIQTPTATYHTDGGVTDMLITDAKLYAATNVGVVEVFDIANGKTLEKIELPKIKDFLGEMIHPKIFSVDVFNKKVLILSQAEGGYREVDLYEKGSLTKVVGTIEKLSIAKAKFIDEDTLLFALLGNDIISYNMKKHKKNWMTQASLSAFSNFALNEKRTQVVVADESGDLHLYATKNAKLLKTLQGQNLDNVFAVDFKNKIIATAGKDRRTVIYDLTFNSSYYKQSSFFIYSVALSPSARLAAYTSDEKNNITVFKTSTKTPLARFGGIHSMVSKILFNGENELFVASGDRVINVYKIR